MRITASLFYQGLSDNVQTSLENLNTIQQQISSGKQLTTFSDDPAGASQALALRSTLGDNTQYQRNAASATLFLKTSDSALADANSVIQSARQLAVQGANSTQSADSFAALSSQVDDIIQRVTQIANTKSGSRYLFGGTNTTTAPYDAAQTYQGNTQTIDAVLGPNYSTRINTVGSTTFDPAFTALQSLKTNLAAGDVAAISADIAGFDTALSAISTARATVGSKTTEVTTVTDRLNRAEGEYKNSISQIEDVNLAQAYVQLQSAQNIYQASLSTTAKAFQYSLVDYLH